jgi:hypothetical protein
MSDYFLTLQSNDEALDTLRTTVGYEISRSILNPKRSKTYNAAASTRTGLPRRELSSIIQDLIYQVTKQIK